MAQPSAAAEVSFPPIVGRPLDPNWTLGILAQYTVLKYFRALLDQRAVVLANQDVEGVHQIRVAARRCRTALQTFRSLWKPQKVRRFQKYLARFADSFGAARDLDVMIIYLGQQLETAEGERAAAYQWLLARNVQCREREQPKLERVLAKLEKDGFAAELVSYFAVAPADLWALEEAVG